MSEANPQFHVIVIGAGPAGLAASVCLARRGIRFTLLERGTTAFAGLRQIDPEMTLLSPTRLSRLPGMHRKEASPAYLTFAALLDELQIYQRQHNISITTKATVLSVEKSGSRYHVRYLNSAGGEQVLGGSHIINATGMIGFPQLPENFHPAACSFSWLHSLDTRAAHLLGGRLLVIGGGASAAEVLERWLEVRRTDAHAWLSVRSRYLALPHRVLGIDLHYLGWLPEHLPTRLLRRDPALIREPMLGRKVPRAIKQGLITELPAVTHFKGAEVELRDGQLLQPDLVVFATGFRYDTTHLQNLVDHYSSGQPRVLNCQSTRAPGLYLLGVPYGRTLASHYLRGIARDARYVAKRIARETRR